MPDLYIDIAIGHVPEMRKIKRMDDSMYSRIKYDVFFKKIFQQEHLLKAFSNTALRDELSAHIAILSFRHLIGEH